MMSLAASTNIIYIYIYMKNNNFKNGPLLIWRTQGCYSRQTAAESPETPAKSFYKLIVCI